MHGKSDKKKDASPEYKQMPRAEVAEDAEIRKRKFWIRAPGGEPPCRSAALSVGSRRSKTDHGQSCVGAGTPESRTRVKKMPSGIPLLPHRPGVIVTNELIEKLREEEGI